MARSTVPAVNWLLMAATLTLAIGFRTSENLAAAYGIAVSADMVLTTFLLSIAIREIWGLPMPAAIAIGVGFATVEGAFLSANMLKFADGGWVPVLLAIVLFALMRIWQTGSAAVQTLADEMQIPIGDIVAQIDRRRNSARAGHWHVFVARISRDIPPLVVWHLRHIRALHDSIGDPQCCHRDDPLRGRGGTVRGAPDRPAGVAKPCSLRFYGAARSTSLAGAGARAEGYPVDPSRVTYFIGRETVVQAQGWQGAAVAGAG